MIDKSIRQYYQDGKKVKKLGWETGKKTIWPELKEQIKSQVLPSKEKIIPDIVRKPLQRKVLSKLGLGAANPLLGLLSLFGIDPFTWAAKKWGKGGVEQAFTAGITGTQADREAAKELRVLEKRRASMLRRKADPNKDYSERNLETVTREIAKRKGLDINNPNEMRNIDKPIEQIRIEKRVTDPVITHPTFTGEARQTISPFPGEDELATDTIAPIIQDPDTGDAQIAERIAAEQRERNRLQREVTRQAEENAARIRAEQAAVALPPQLGGGDGGGQDYGHQETRSSSGWERSPFKKGGRIDKALTGRSRDI